MVISPINLGRMLEIRARQRSPEALEKLLDLTPPTAYLITDEGEKSMSLAEVQPGMLLCLATGDRTPVNSEITQNEAWLDEAMLTGGPIPQRRGEGESAHAETMIQDGSVPFRAGTIDSHATLSRVIRMVRQARSSKPEIGQLADKVSAVLIPVVVMIALISAVIWYFFGPAPQIVYTLVIITMALIITCPYVLRLATPMSIASGVGRVAELDVLVRDVDTPQRVSTPDTVVFNKTGTLTKGESRVVTVKTLVDVDETRTLRLAAALEQGSGYPLARTTLDKTGDTQLPQVNSFRTLRGPGMSGEAEGHALLPGDQAPLDEQQVGIKAIEAGITAQASQGATPVLLAVDGKAVALLAVCDPLRSDSVAALRYLHRAGYCLVMLTGGNPATANAIAKETGIDEMIAEVLPGGKAEAVKRL